MMIRMTRTTKTENGPKRRFDARTVITGALIAAICAIFWLGSRYPSLQSKAGADPDEALSTPLGFESHFPEPRADEKFKRVLWVAVEWGVTNKQGMTFGILLAAALLTVVPLLPRPRSGKFAGAVQGMLLGAPLVAILKVVFDRVESLKPAGALLGQ